MRVSRQAPRGDQREGGMNRIKRLKPTAALPFAEAPRLNRNVGRLNI